MTDVQRIAALERQLIAALALLADQNAIIGRLAFAVFQLQTAAADDAWPSDRVQIQARPH